ncbi:MAG: helix-turn-helix transcriptional regulator, partial [Gammaproteobacteria bacterium]|nr:helix-turn-helix transcriptional regulator [Gammaproteobacteria bacterium]
QMARTLHMSERSLRRQLELDGTGWRRLVDEVLQEMACDLLHTSPLSVQQVAEQLGYAEPSSFSHAFKRWTGVSPEQYRRQPLSARLTTLTTPAHART